MRLLLVLPLLALAPFMAPMAAPAYGQAADTSDRQPSTCLAIAKNIHSPELPVRFASFAQPASSAYDVTISYEGHSTYLIESPEGVKIATDFAGYMAKPVVPDVVTMNHAHSSHYTDFPDPEIRHVLRGWGTDGDIARHHLSVGDVLVRNVTTDLMRWRAEPDGNSIFIFETGGLCIGHLGHLHHRLSEDHYAKIGRLDVVMIAVDGGITMTHLSARDILDRLRSSVVLPMHVRAPGALGKFLSYLGDGFAVERLRDNRLVLNVRNLPKRPTVKILPGVSYAGWDQ